MQWEAEAGQGDDEAPGESRAFSTCVRVLLSGVLIRAAFGTLTYGPVAIAFVGELLLRDLNATAWWEALFKALFVFSIAAVHLAVLVLAANGLLRGSLLNARIAAGLAGAPILHPIFDIVATPLAILLLVLLFLPAARVMFQLGESPPESSSTMEQRS